MQIRRLEAADAVNAARLCSIAYEASLDIHAPHSEFEQGPIWGAWEDGVLFSQMQCLPFEIRFDGHWVPMGGIAGVATLPEYRRRGGVRAIFKELFPVMREEGQVFSTLYPFAFGFYRKFGYEAVYRETRLTIPLISLNRLPKPESVRFQEPGDPVEALNRIYEQFVEDRALAVRRPPDYWRSHCLPSDPYKDRRHTYVLQGASGSPEAYFTFHPDNGDRGRTMRVRDWAAATADGMKRLLGFIGTYSSHFKAVDLTLPLDLAPELMLAEYYDLQSRTSWSGMHRIVDVEAALRLARWPAGSGRVVIQVKDDTADWNEDTFAVEFESGQGSVSRVRSDPDLEVDVRTLARLLLGAVSLDEPSADLLPGLAASSLLPNGLFPRKRSWLNDHF